MPPLLLLGSGAVLLVKSAVGHLQTGKGPDANRQDGEDDEESNESREDACIRSAGGRRIYYTRGLPGVKNWYFSKRGRVSLVVLEALRAPARTGCSTARLRSRWFL